MSPDAFEREMDKLAAAYGDVPSPARIAVYLEHLGNLDDALIRAACTRAIREYPYKFPPVAILLGYVRDLEIAAGRRFDGATAWARIERQILARYPDYRTADWPDELASEVFRAELGLPYDVARLDNDYDRARARARFVAAYDRQRAAADAALPSKSPLDAGAPPHGVASHLHAGPGWHPTYQACRGCGTRVIPHHAEGRCRDCYRAAHGLAGAVELWGEADEHPAWTMTAERE